MAEPGEFWRNYFAGREADRMIRNRKFGALTGPRPAGATPPAAGQPGFQQIVSEQLAQRQAADANFAKLGQSPLTQVGPQRAFTGPQAAAVERTLGQAAASALPAAETTGARVAAIPAQRAGSLVASNLGRVGGMTVGGSPAPQGLLAAASGRLGSIGSGIAANGWKGGLLPGAIAFGGQMAGNALDESQLLGGDESVANDTASKALKWGATGAGAGLLVGGPAGALIGGLGGTVVGLGHQILENEGVLGTPSKQEQVDKLVHDAEAAAAEIGLPREVVDELKVQFNAGKKFVDTKDEKIALAQTFADQVEEYALDYAVNPDNYTPGGSDQEGLMVARAQMMNAIKPYANNFLAQTSAQADAYQNMAAGAGDMAPMYEQMAANTRASGARQAMGVVQETQITPYQQALEKQAGYLNQMSSSLVSQAMGQVMPGASANAGSVDLTALIDGAANQMQPE